MTYLQIDDALVDEAHAFLGCRRQRPTLGYLDALIGAFAHRVPWESVFRLIKREAATRPADCLRWPQEVWRDALDFGGVLPHLRRKSLHRPGAGGGDGGGA